jgi:hypothetical protein
LKHFVGSIISMLAFVHAMPSLFCKNLVPYIFSLSKFHQSHFLPPNTFGSSSSFLLPFFALDTFGRLLRNPNIPMVCLIL